MRDLTVRLRTAEIAVAGHRDRAPQLTGHLSGVQTALTCLRWPHPTSEQVRGRPRLRSAVRITQPATQQARIALD
jgi:hypothetical protein